MSSAASPDAAATRHGSPVPSPLSRELDRARRVRWLGVGAAAVVVLIVLWVLGVRPAGIDLLGVVVGALLVVTGMYGLEVVVAEWRSQRLLRLAAAGEQRRQHLTEALARSEEVDVAARSLVDATTPNEVADRLLTAARRLVPAGAGAVLLRAADDLVLTLTGEAAVDVPPLTSEAEGLAGRVLARGVTARYPPTTAGAAADGRPQVAVPLRAGADVVGVLVLERGPGDIGFDVTEQRALERLAPHGARSLARTSDQLAADSVPATRARPAARRIGVGGGPREVDLGGLLRGLAVGRPGVGSEAARRVVVLATATALIHADPVALRTMLEGLLGCVDAHAPDQGAIAIEVLPFDREIEIVVAHGGGVLPGAVLDETPADGDRTVTLRQAIVDLGGTVSARERSGVAQVRVRLPVAGPGALDPGPQGAPVETSAHA